jgi:hypothetical protein
MGGNDMLVSELIAYLEDFNDDEEVRISQPTHDYWHTIDAVTIDYVDVTVVGESGQIYDAAFDAERNEDAPTTMIVIRG